MTSSTGARTLPMLVAVLCAVTAVAPAHAAVHQAPVSGTQRPVQIPRLTQPIAFDGFADDPAWQAIPPLPAVMQAPTFGEAPSERTEFRLAHDDEYLYAAARLYDSDPSGIRATSLRRNDNSPSNDWFVLVLDTFNDKENALAFGTSPAGIRTDVATSRDGAGLNFDWNTYWDAAVQVTDEGWFAEIRIPLSSLRFQEQDGRVVMGVILWRLIARKNEFIVYPAIPPNWGTRSVWRVSRAQEIVLNDVARVNPVYLTPYLLGGTGRTHELNATETAYIRDSEPVRDAGLDLKYGLTPNLTLDLTLNTDFAQVEADDREVNLTRFSLFFPEKRQFFQERASVFNFPLVGDERLFYSRRIGLVDGRPARIYGGGRVVGRVGGWDVGVLNMQTAAEGDVAGENFGVARLRRRVLNENSYVGGILTSRVGRGGARNTAFGLDAIVRVFGDEYLTASWAQTFDRGDSAGVGPLDRGFASIAWERSGIDGWIYALELAHAGEALDPGVGFVRRTGYLRGGGRLSYGWRPAPESPVLRHELSVTGEGYRRTSDGTLESTQGHARWQIEMKTGASTELGLIRAQDDVDAAFSLGSGVEVLPGEYTMLVGRAVFRASAAGALRPTVEVEAGEYYDGRRVSPGGSLIWNASRHFQLDANYAFNRIDFPDTGQRLRTHVARLRTRLMVDPRWTTTAFLQYSSLGDVAILNMRLRYNPREGNDFYLVFNEVLNTARSGAAPLLPRTDSRTLLLKYSHTLPFVF